MDHSFEKIDSILAVNRYIIVKDFENADLWMEMECLDDVYYVVAELSFEDQPTIDIVHSYKRKVGENHLSGKELLKRVDRVASELQEEIRADIIRHAKWRK